MFYKYFNLKINIFNCELLKIIYSYFSIMSETVIDLHTIDNKGVANHGGGLELLMNDKRQKSQSIDIGLGELSELENELNTLTDDINIKSKPLDSGGKSGLFTSAINSVNLDNFSEKVPSVTFEDFKTDNEINLGTSTVETSKDTKTWDGYGKFNNIPTPNLEPQLTKEELLREKFKILKKLEDLERKGANLSKKYSMEDSLNEMQGEYEMLINEKEKSNSVKFQGKILMAAITGLEFLNNKFDPFDVKIDGWSEQINENIDDYDEIFAELHEKYKSKATMAPELKLLFQLGGSALMVHMTNSMFKSSMPGVDDIMRQNPDLMQQFTSAAVNSMGQTNPGLGGFMSSLSGSQPQPPQQQMNPMSQQRQSRNAPTTVNPQARGGPPPPLATQGPESQQPPIRSGYVPLSNRPDINASRNISLPEKSHRPEMKGPTDISNILSGLKMKNKSEVNIHNDKEDLQNDNIPLKSKRRKSDRNTVSLDI